jgi:hypothetical protein
VHRNRAIWLFTVCLALPVAWLVATTAMDGLRAVALVLGAIVSAGIMVALAWRAHRAGLLLANRCATCERPMCYTQPGEVTPPRGSEVVQARFWRCRHCGRLV